MHDEAPAATLVDSEMRAFLRWLNAHDDMDLVSKAAIAHLWFLTVHPFDDGNGRIARALTDLFLSRSKGSAQRFYRMSSQLHQERVAYYKIRKRRNPRSSEETQER